MPGSRVPATPIGSPERADEGVRIGASSLDVCDSSVRHSQEEKHEGRTDQVSQTQDEQDRVSEVDTNTREQQPETAEPTGQVEGGVEGPGQEEKMPDLESDNHATAKHEPSTTHTPTVKEEQPTGESGGSLLPGQTEEVQVPIPDPPSPEALRRSTRTNRGVRDHGAAISHAPTNGLSATVLPDQALSHWDGGEVLHVSVEDAGRTEEGYAAQTTQENGGETSLAAISTQDGIEECLFTVPIVVKNAIAYYKGTKVSDISVPRNFNQAQVALFKVEWDGAMDDEFNPLVEKGTWMPVYPEKGDKIMGCLWVYSLKVDLKRQEMRFKARLCAQGSGRMLGIDHTEEEVYANVLKLKTLRINLALAIQDPEARVSHWDIKNAFVATDMAKHKVIRMRQPQGYYVYGGKVLQLLKALYGLPESMRLFTDNLKEHLLAFGFKKCKSDPSMYLFFRGKKWIRVPVWVDDLFPTSNSEKLRDEVFKHISENLS